MSSNKYEVIYTSTNCNQCPNALHWGNNNLICYASCNSICIYDPHFGSGGKVLQTLAKHTKQVNSVRWLAGSDIPEENEIISGSVDGTVIVWTLENNVHKYQILKGHENNVTVVDGLYKSDQKEDSVIVSASMSGAVKIWLRKNITDEFVEVQTIDFGYHICIALKLSVLNDLNRDLILALSLDNSIINIYTENKDSFFAPQTQLKGHEDWVTGLDFTIDGDDVLLASSGQDNFIRIWRFTKDSLHESHQLSIKSPNFSFKIHVESILIGHAGWVYSVAWNPINKTLLSASYDKTMVIWEYDEENKLWMDDTRVGEVGGNTLGFFGGTFDPDGEIILGYGYHGAFHVWKSFDDEWVPQVTIGGHFRGVVDIGWDPKGSYLFSASSDQTCRIHAPYQTGENQLTWHEIARPQIHGYDMNAIAVFSKYKYASISEEKVIRTFTAPQNFIDNFKRICKVDEDCKDENAGAKGASVPSLGLSNKAVFSDNNDEQSRVKNSKEVYPEESHFSAVELKEPPTEETLLQNTLWPEICKLYGHGYEVYCLAASPDGKYLASACKSTTQEHASVLLWNTRDWKLDQKLTSHTLTVTQIAFSPDSTRILTVSRDRRWSIFEKNDEEKYNLTGTTNKSTGIHTRVIWSCCWTHDSKYFATGSRDGKLVVWYKNHDKPMENILGQYEVASEHLSLPKDSITAVAAAPCMVSNNYLFGVGLESGLVFFYKWTIENLWQCVLQFDENIGHHLTVKRIQFRPILGQAGCENDDENVLQVATCSLDTSVKIYSLFINKL